MQEKLLDAIHGCTEPRGTLERSSTMWPLHNAKCFMNIDWRN